MPPAGQAILVPSGSPLPAGCGSADDRCLYWLRFRNNDKPDADRILFALVPIPLSEAARNRLRYGFCQLLRESESLQGTSEICDYMLSTILLSLRDNSRRVSDDCNGNYLDDGNHFTIHDIT